MATRSQTKGRATPKQSKVAPHVLDARKAKAAQLVTAQRTLDRQAKVAQRLVRAKDHPMTDEAAAQHAEAATSARAHLDEVLRLTGLAEADVFDADQHRAGLEAAVGEWKRLRDVHGDFLANPDLWETDLGSQPIDPVQQRAIVAEYDAHIAEAQAELKTLGS